jgi:hypothetical protein
MWLEVCRITKSLVLSGSKDELIWQYQPLGVYSSHSLYSIINFRRVLPVYILAVWKIWVPPRVHFFMWLTSQDRSLTRNNLGKRRHLDDSSCVF